MAPDPDSFRGKVWLSFIDKVALGLLVAGALLWVECQQERLTRRTVRLEKLSELEAGRTSRLVEGLSEPVHGLAALLREHRTSGFAGAATELLELQGRVIEIEQGLELVSIHSQSEQTRGAASSLDDLRQEIYSEAASNRAKPRDYDGFATELRQRYAELALAVHEETVERVRSVTAE